MLTKIMKEIPRCSFKVEHATAKTTQHLYNNNSKLGNKMADTKNGFHDA